MAMAEIKPTPVDDGGGAVCHALPCSVEEDLTAPVAQYFRPTPLASKPKEGDGDSGRDDAIVVVAAQFRGRGLLCAADGPRPCPEPNSSSPSAGAPLSRLPPSVAGVVLSPPSSSGRASAPLSLPQSESAASRDPPARPLKVLETFRHVYDWKHEHDARKVEREVRGSRGGDKHGLGAALGWCELSREVHDPIPLPP